jgi:Phage major capsid protein E
MAVIDDILDQAALTDSIVGPVETEMELAPFLGEQIAPMFDVDNQYISMRVEDVHAYGIGQFRAPEATPPLMDITGREEREEVIELAHLDEMHRISPLRWERLNSNDDRVSGREARSLIEIGQILERRNERLTEWMRWQAFSGQLTIEYQQRDTALVIDYPLPSGHRPTVGVSWDDTTNADPVNDMRTWQTQVATSSGFAGTRIHMSSVDLENVLNNAKLRDYFNVAPGQPFLPTLDDVLRLLRPGTQIITFDTAYREESVGASRRPEDHTRFLPTGSVLMTTEYTIDGAPIADTPNGLVEISTGYNTTALLPGPQSEVIMKGDGVYQRFLRQASRRIVRLRRPEAFLFADIT